MKIQSFFDDAYSRHDRYWWREETRYATEPDAYPHSLVTQALLRSLVGRPPGRAIDLGAGEGTDSIRLALLGYTVDAVEMSPIGASKIQHFAAQEGVGSLINVHAMNLTAFISSTSYDVVVMNGVLHYVEEKEVVIRALQAVTNPGGLHALSLWSTYSPVPTYHSRVPVYCDDEDGIVSKLYVAWPKELLYFERNKSDTSHDDLPPHLHSHIKIVARCPDTPPAAG